METIQKQQQDLKNKNEKLIEMLTELEEVKVQVHARDKTIELQQGQIQELLEELRESKSLENDVKLLLQKKNALATENEKLKEELQMNLIEGDFKQEGANQAEVDELMMANQSLSEQISTLQAKHKDSDKKKDH